MHRLSSGIFTVNDAMEVSVRQEKGGQRQRDPHGGPQSSETDRPAAECAGKKGHCKISLERGEHNLIDTIQTMKQKSNMRKI